MSTTAEQVLDDLTEHDVKKARVEAHVRRRIAARMDELQKELRRLAEEIDPAGTLRTDARRRRVAKLEAASREAIRQAYADIHAMVKRDMRAVAEAESEITAAALENNIP